MNEKDLDDALELARDMCNDAQFGVRGTRGGVRAKLAAALIALHADRESSVTCAVLAEREACATIAEGPIEPGVNTIGLGQDIAAAIRARE